MGQFLQINGDYNIKAGDGAKITLDTGPASAGGQVVVTGDFIVLGERISVEATELSITDNIILLNKGEIGPGVTLGYSGIEVDRGVTPGSVDEPSSNSSFLWDESTNTWFVAQGTAPGLFNYNFSRLRLKEILTNAATDSGDLILIGTGTGVVKVIGTDNYEDQVTADDDIPNKKYVDDSILNSPTFQIVAPQGQDTRVVIADKEISPNSSLQPGSLAYFTATTSYDTDAKSAVSILVDGTLSTQFYNDKVLFGESGSYGLEIDAVNYEIRTETSITDQNIWIKTAGTGKLQTNYALQIDKIGVTPTYVADSLLLYSAEPGIGSSGVWFINDSADVAKRNGELISKNKALVFSMLF
jgi:hypothetical protein